MTSPDPLDPQLLDRYLAGIATDADVRAVVDWMARDPRNRALIEGLAQQASPALPLTTDESWRAVQARLSDVPAGVAGESQHVQDGTAADRASVVSIGTQRAKRRVAAEKSARRIGGGVLPMVLRIAAALLLVVGGTATWRATRAPEQHEVVAALGKSTTLSLADGSRVTLAPGSRITWTGEFGSASRELTLVGEAYFAVVHDSARPFRVRAQSGIAEDIGTRFVVRAWSSSAPLDVAVEEGAVALSDTTEAARLVATTLRVGDRGQLGRDGVVSVSHDAELMLAWTRGELVFADTPLADALVEISRWYNTDLHASPALAARRLNARFLSQPLPELINSLALALDASVVRDGPRVTLVPKTP